MKATGIVRRIDGLGRVVIPKEIRRTLRIRMGAPTEFIDTGIRVLYGCGIGFGTVHREVNIVKLPSDYQKNAVETKNCIFHRKTYHKKYADKYRILSAYFVYYVSGSIE